MARPDFAVSWTRRSVRLTCALAVALIAFAAPCAKAQGNDVRGLDDKPNTTKPKGRPGGGRRGKPNPSRRPATLIVVSQPGGCAVSIDGGAKGTTDVAGTLKLTVPAGSRHVTVTRHGYQAASIALELKAGERRELSAVLSPLAGHLGVAVTPPDAVIHIIGVGTFRGPSIDHDLPSGSYEIQVSRAGYRKESRSVTIGPAEQVSVDVALDEIPHRELLDAADEAFKRGEYNRSAEICTDVLTRRPNNRRALLRLGWSNFYVGRFDESAEFFLGAIKHGDEVHFTVYHLHESRRRLDFCVGEVIVRADALDFRSSSAPSHNLSIALRSLRSTSYQGSNAHRLVIRVATTEGRKERLSDYAFYPSGASANGSVVTCNGCVKTTSVIHQILQLLSR